MQQAATKNMLLFKNRSLNVKFDLSKTNYKALENIGTGAYGVVCSAENVKTGKKVAIKKIPNAFDEITTAKRTFRELKILRHFDHENIIGIRELLMPKEMLSEFKDVYVVMDLMESDLHQILHSHQPFTIEHARYFLYQILRGLKYIHSANVIHRDLKPSNLLVNENCELRIGDFGMARGISAKAENQSKIFMTQYVATRWYRAPELLFSVSEYSESVDMWSVGCIFAEMLSRKQIFPGRNPMHQLTLIVDLLGVPPDSMLENTQSEQVVTFFRKNFGGRKPIGLKSKYKDADPMALDLLGKMLVINPTERITVLDSLKHPFLEKYYDPEDEPECFPPFDFSFDQKNMTTDQIRQQIGKMILKYNRPSFGKLNLSQLGTGKQQTNGDVGRKVVEPSGMEGKQLKDGSGAVKEGVLLEAPQTEKDANVTSSKEDIPEVVFVKPATPPNITTTVTSGNALTAPSHSQGDVDMLSARSACNDAVNSILVIAAENTASAKHLGCNKEQVDVDMKSAKSGDARSRLPSQSGDINGLLPMQNSDIQMLSASEKGKGEETTKETTAVIAVPSPCNVGTAGEGEKKDASVIDTVSSGTKVEDTKALVRAALKNSLLKNKMRKERGDSNIGDPVTKTAVTALSRQREREEKRKQKMRRSQDRQKKLKALFSDREKRELMLTDQDKSMLERWNKMQKSGGATNEIRLGELNQQSNFKPIAPKPCAVNNDRVSGNTTITTTLYTLGTSTNTTAFISNNVPLLPVSSLEPSSNQQNVILLQPVTQMTNFSNNVSTSSVFSDHPNSLIYPKQDPVGRPAGNENSQLQYPSSTFLGSDQADMESVFLGHDDMRLDGPLSGSTFLGSLGISPTTSFVSPGRYRSCSDRETPSPPISTQNTNVPSVNQEATGHSLQLVDAAQSILEEDLGKAASTPPDVAAIITQLDRAGVEDRMPFLELTPRGDGTGYGLGLNLEELLNQTLEETDLPTDDANNIEGPPLSASVLSGILQEHNLNSDDMVALQKELGLSSPITLSKLSPSSVQSEVTTS